MGFLTTIGFHNKDEQSQQQQPANQPAVGIDNIQGLPDDPAQRIGIAKLLDYLSSTFKVIGGSGVEDFILITRCRKDAQDELDIDSLCVGVTAHPAGDAAMINVKKLIEAAINRGGLDTLANIAATKAEKH